MSGTKGCHRETEMSKVWQTGPGHRAGVGGVPRVPQDADDGPAIPPGHPGGWNVLPRMVRGTAGPAQVGHPRGVLGQLGGVDAEVHQQAALQGVGKVMTEDMGPWQETAVRVLEDVEVQP